MEVQAIAGLGKIRRCKDISFCTKLKRFRSIVLIALQMRELDADSRLGEEASGV